MPKNPSLADDPGPLPKSERNSPDAEFSAMRRIFGILMALPPSARARVVAYTIDRLPSLPPGVTMGPAGDESA